MNVKSMKLLLNKVSTILITILFAFIIVNNASAKESTKAISPPSPPENWREGYVIANGIRIHYWRTGGEKPVMVLAHGYSDNGLCWTNLVKELEDDYDLIMYDARGHGYSDPPTKSDHADAQCEDLAGLINELNLKKPILMGHSMGSASVAWCASRYPEIPSAVILEDPRLVAIPSNYRSANRSLAEQEKESRKILDRNNKTYQELVGDCMKNDPKWGKNECEVWAPSKKLYHPNNAYRRIGDRPENSDLFTKITAPTLILKADDKGKLREQNIEVTNLLKEGTIVHVEGAHHNVRRDQKERLLQALEQFLNDL